MGHLDQIGQQPGETPCGTSLSWPELSRRELVRRVKQCLLETPDSRPTSLSPISPNAASEITFHFG
jgi:hypothetical protein